MTRHNQQDEEKGSSKERWVLGSIIAVLLAYIVYFQLGKGLWGETAVQAYVDAVIPMPSEPGEMVKLGKDQIEKLAQQMSRSYTASALDHHLVALQQSDLAFYRVLEIAFNAEKNPGDGGLLDRLLDAGAIFTGGMLGGLFYQGKALAREFTTQSRLDYFKQVIAQVKEYRLMLQSRIDLVSSASVKAHEMQRQWLEVLRDALPHISSVMIGTMVFVMFTLVALKYASYRSRGQELEHQRLMAQIERESTAAATPAPAAAAE